MQRLERLDELLRSELLSVAQLLRVEKLSAKTQDDIEFLHEVKRRLQMAVQASEPATVWDELLQRLEDESYEEPAELPSQFTHAATRWQNFRHGGQMGYQG